MNILSQKQQLFTLPCASVAEVKNSSYQPKVSFAGGKDVFVKKTICEPLAEGIRCISKVKPGEFGSVCEGSIPLTSFFESIPQNEQANVIEKGFSTNKIGVPNCFLKSSADKPLSTSSVFNCSVMYLFNKDTNTHFIYHASPDEKKETLDFMVKYFMPEGVTHACFSPGTKEYSFTHGQVLNKMYSVVRKNNKKAVINVFHQSSMYPEVVGYRGRLFEIPNEGLELGKRETFGQASFKISDLRDENTIGRLKQDCTSSNHVKYLKDDLIEDGWDDELKKTISEIIDKRAAMIVKIEECKTTNDLQKLVTNSEQGMIRECMPVVNIQYYRIVNGFITP